MGFKVLGMILVIKVEYLGKNPFLVELSLLVSLTRPRYLMLVMHGMNLSFVTNIEYHVIIVTTFMTRKCTAQQWNC